MDEKLTVNNFEKNIYNTYLSTLRKSQNKPFKYRKNFENLDKNLIITLKKLSIFFNEFDTIDIEEFFKAPFVVYDDTDHLELSYFSSRKAIKAYTHLQTVLATADPDSKYVLTKFVESMRFLKSYCKENSIEPDDYLSHVEEGSKIESFLIHLKNKKISFYTICALTTSGGSVRSDSVDLLYPNFYELLAMCRGKFMRSKKMRLLSKKTIQILKN